MVSASPAAVERKLAAPPQFSHRLPAFLALGFPRPASASGAGLDVGSRRVITYSGRDSELVAVVSDRAPGYVNFQPVRDTSPISRWLTWTASEVRWAPTGDGRTRVTWTLHFARRLAPAWYFGSIESFGATNTAQYLIDALATP
jgi:hypothetical protein